MAKSKQETPETAAQRLLDEMNITTIPVPIEKIAKRLKVQLRFQPLDDELSGMIFMKDDVVIIGVNALHHPNRQRFTIAHEIGHCRLHAEHITGTVHVDKQFAVSVLRRDGLSAQGTERLEIEANQFASAVLMPKKVLTGMLEPYHADIDAELPLDEWAKKFKVSRAALEYRIRNLGYERV